jgi:two-component system chemotaxis response regulator CheY
LQTIEIAALCYVSDKEENMNILIVDDNKNNRMIIGLLLEEYANEYDDASFTVTEAEDGSIALEHVKNNHFDLIFMDIMMPNMDGIAATKAIRRIDKKSMIIAVSSVEDDERKKIILNNGAEDYISKPVNGDTFTARLKSYVKLIGSRQGNHRKGKKAYNLFGETVYSYNMHFNGEDEDMLSEFWEYYLLNDTPYDGISDMVRFIYDMSLEALKKANRVDIYEENSDTYLYLTLVSPVLLDPDLIMLYADKNEFIDNYKVDGKQLSAKLTKVKVFNFIEPVKPVNETVASTPKKVTEKGAPAKKESIEKQTTGPTVFNFLDDDDYLDLKDYISQLNSLLLIVGNGDIEEHEVNDIVVTLLQISRTIRVYPELYNIGTCLEHLGRTITQYKEVFVAQSTSLRPLATAFGGDLSKWFKSLFMEGASSVDFLDDSIISNATMIENFIDPSKMESDDSEDIDDIFDF